MKDKQRVVVREAPCSSCPPWTRRHIVKGDKGRVDHWCDATKSYWVAVDRIPGESTGICPRHLESVE